jgi:hypothetical protein
MVGVKKTAMCLTTATDASNFVGKEKMKSGEVDWFIG